MNIDYQLLANAIAQRDLCLKRARCWPLCNPQRDPISAEELPVELDPAAMLEVKLMLHQLRARTDC